MWKCGIRMKNLDSEASVLYKKSNPLLKLTFQKNHLKEEILAHKYEIYQTNTNTLIHTNTQWKKWYQSKE